MNAYKIQSLDALVLPVLVFALYRHHWTVECWMNDKRCLIFLLNFIMHCSQLAATDRISIRQLFIFHGHRLLKIIFFLRKLFAGSNSLSAPMNGDDESELLNKTVLRYFCFLYILCSSMIKIIFDAMTPWIYPHSSHSPHEKSPHSKSFPHHKIINNKR